MIDEQEFQLSPHSTIRSSLIETGAFLEAHGLPEPRRDAELLLSYLLSKDRAYLLAHPEEPLPANGMRQLADLAILRSRHYPIQYFTGVQEFYGRDFLTTPATLIPRPETELLIDVSLALAAELPGPLRILDIGTGTGCLALTLLLELSDSQAVAADISIGALRVADANARRLGCRPRVSFVNCDLLTAFDRAGSFDLIISNPPYVSSIADDVEFGVREHEPSQAIFAGPTGLEVYCHLFSTAPPLLAPQGFLVLELGAGQQRAVASEARKKGWKEVSVRQDLAGHARCAIFRLATPHNHSSARALPAAHVPAKAS